MRPKVELLWKIKTISTKKIAGSFNERMKK
jgi:hypothetical protein